MTSQGASSLEALVDQQTLELWSKECWEGAYKIKYGPGMLGSGMGSFWCLSDCW